jgi:hypothetical protein
VHANDELRADGLGQQRIAVAHAGAAVDAQAFRLVVHGDEQQADIGIDDDVAEALEHAVAVIVGKCDLGRAGDAHKARRAALERAIGPASASAVARKKYGRLSMYSLSSAENSLRISFCSSRSEIRRLSNRSCSCRLPSWYMTLSAMALRPPPIDLGMRVRGQVPPGSISLHG